MNPARSLSFPSETSFPESSPGLRQPFVWSLDAEQGAFFASPALCQLWQADPRVGIPDYLTFVAGLTEDSQLGLEAALQQLLLHQRPLTRMLTYQQEGIRESFVCTFQILLRPGASPLVHCEMSLQHEGLSPSRSQSEALLFRVQVERLTQMWFDTALSPEVQLQQALVQAGGYLDMAWGRISSLSSQAVRRVSGWQDQSQPSHIEALSSHGAPAGTLWVWGVEMPSGIYPFQTPAVPPTQAGLALSFEVAEGELGVLEWGRLDASGGVLSAYQIQFFLMLTAWMGYLLQRERSLSRLKGLNASQERLLSMLAHDVRNAMSSVLGGSNLLRRRQLVSKEGVEVLDFVQRAGQHILRLLQEVLAMSELELRDGRRGFGSFDVNRLAQESLAKWMVLAQEQEVQLRYHLAEQPLRLHLHPAWFEQLLDNLLSNALKFTPAGGLITFQTALQADHIVLTVSDSGIGIPVDMQEELFVRFTPSRRSGLRGEKSTGLGMYMMQQIVLLHGGHLQLESQENQGTCLTLRFAAESGQETEA
ncbi:MAG: sensor histidine kinase [Candidatus Sericytochromatia bacterium]